MIDKGSEPAYIRQYITLRAYTNKNHGEICDIIGINRNTMYKYINDIDYNIENRINEEISKNEQKFKKQFGERWDRIIDKSIKLYEDILDGVNMGDDDNPVFPSITEKLRVAEKSLQGKGQLKEHVEADINQTIEVELVDD